MEKFKMNLDREGMSSDQIQNYQNFNQLKKDFELLKKPFWKNPWFWGTGGVASTAIILSIGVLTNSKPETNETISTINIEEDISQNIQTDPLFTLTALNDTQETSLSSEETNFVEPNIPQRKSEEKRVEKSEAQTVKKVRTLKLDLLEDEFPSLQPLIGSELEILDGSQFDPRWFERTWDDIQLITLGENKYLIKFSDGREVNKMYVKTRNQHS